MCTIADNPDNPFTTGDPTWPLKLASEPIPDGGTGASLAEFVHSDGLKYDIQYVQIDWASADGVVFGGMAARMNFAAWKGLATLVESFTSPPPDQSYFRPSNLIPNTRGLEFGANGASSYDSFKRFTDAHCSCQ